MVADYQISQTTTGYQTSQLNTSRYTILPSTPEQLIQFTINAANYYYLSVSDFAGDVTSGFVEVRFYYDGAAGFRYLFTSIDEAYSTRYFSVMCNSGICVVAVRDGGAGIYNQYNADDELSVGWHTVRFISSGSDYSILVGGVEVDGTIATGVDDGKWIGDVGYSSFLRDNIMIGAKKDSGGIATSVEYECEYVNFNGANKWVAQDV